MKTIQIALKDIKPNPFKKFINSGKLNEEIVEKLLEGFEQTEFHENLIAREHEGNIELLYGHHRIEALKRKFGQNHKINIAIKDLNDETMLIDMIRENITQRNLDAQDTMDNFMLAKRWLEGDKLVCIPGIHTKKNIEKGKKGFQTVPASTRAIAEFLSKKGKAVSKDTVANYLRMHEDLHPKLRPLVRNIENKESGEESIGVKEALSLVTLPKEEQPKVWDQAKKQDLNYEDFTELIKNYRAASEPTKKAIQEGNKTLESLKEDENRQGIKQIAKEMAEEIEDTYTKMKASGLLPKEMSQKERKVQGLILELEVIISLLKAKKLYCPNHNRQELVWACCKKPLEKTLAELKKEAGES